MTRRWLTVVVAGALLGSCSAVDPPLWSGASHRESERELAVNRGLDSIYASAQAPDDFAEYASDYLWCFYSIAATAGEPTVARRAQVYGRELAFRWRRLPRPTIALADADTVADLAMSLDASEALGVADPALRRALEARIDALDADAFLDFDPRTEPPPTRILTLTGEEACIAAGRPEASPASCAPVRRRIVDLDVYYDALITTYFGDRFGVTLGASFSDVMKWRQRLLPYAGRESLGEDTWYDLAYLVTHIVYTHNHYGQLRLDPAALPQEYAFLRQTFDIVLADGDAETFAEFVDTLKSFGHTAENDPQLRRALASILEEQNADGSWGDQSEPDAYDRFHPTWTAVDALKTYTFQ